MQFANIGLNAGKIEFFHQPSRIELQRAKRELIKLGALDENNVVTSIGREMVRLPLNAQLARMIVEAEKLGVTEDVIKIASIVEMGGLLLKNSYYSSFTNERTSDLLAELDVWNHLNSQDEIDFEGEGINKKNFFKIKEHIQAVTEAVSEYVTITSSNMRDNILKACLVGLGSHIFVRNWNGFIDNSGIRRKLDRKSCVEFFGADFLIGIPKTIEYKDRYGYLAKMELISFATAIDGRTALEVVPKSYIYEETTEEYSEVDDVVVKKVVAYILGKSARVLYIKDYCNPRYEELKKEYEEYCLRKAAYYDAGTEKHQMRQDEVTVNGTQYTVYYDGDEPYINLFSNKELMEIKAEHITLLDGTIVTVKCEGKSNKSVATLQRMVGEYITVIVRKYNRSKFNMNGVGSIGDVIRVKDYLTKLSLDGSLAGYTGISVTAYGCLKRQKDGRVILDIVDEAKIAETQTAEALKYLAMKKLKKDYVDSKFSHNTGKKKKTLTPQEETVKEDFWHLATDVVASIKVENIEESLQFVQEYYAELMS